ncbi:MAG: acetylglutamate kinase [Polyangiaceae bacterium]
MVVKLGGNAAESEGWAEDVAALVKAGHQITIVHGGGPQTTALQEKLGQTPRKVAGRRITDGPTLDAIKMVVGGKINIDLCARLLAAGALPVGLHGASSCVIEAERRPPSLYAGETEPVDLGLVGDVTAIRASLLEMLAAAGHVPVLACIGANARGEVFNINADVVAGRVAVLLKADALAMVSDIRGVLRDRNDPESRIGTITRGEGERLIAEGVVTDGMIPKVEEAFATIEAGVGRVHILGRLAPGELQEELLHPGRVGTAFCP